MYLPCLVNVWKIKELGLEVIFSHIATYNKAEKLELKPHYRDRCMKHNSYHPIYLATQSHAQILLEKC